MKFLNRTEIKVTKIYLLRRVILLDTLNKMAEDLKPRQAAETQQQMLVSLKENEVYEYFYMKSNRVCQCPNLFHF